MGFCRERGRVSRVGRWWRRGDSYKANGMLKDGGELDVGVITHCLGLALCFFVARWMDWLEAHDDTCLGVLGVLLT